MSHTMMIISVVFFSIVIIFCILLGIAYIQKWMREDKKKKIIDITFAQGTEPGDEIYYAEKDPAD